MWGMKAAAAEKAAATAEVAEAATSSRQTKQMTKQMTEAEKAATEANAKARAYNYLPDSANERNRYTSPRADYFTDSSNSSSTRRTDSDGY
jgi:hypothetical protein